MGKRYFIEIEADITGVYEDKDKIIGTERAILGDNQQFDGPIASVAFRTAPGHQNSMVWQGVVNDGAPSRINIYPAYSPYPGIRETKSPRVKRVIRVDGTSEADDIFQGNPTASQPRLETPPMVINNTTNIV